MTETQVKLVDPAGQKAEKKYTFDHAFWSHDGFTTDESGYSNPDPGSTYVDQKKVWDLLGTVVLDKAMKGLNVSLFAYGQTGAGKSYSIFGYGANKGIIPMAGVKIFEEIARNQEADARFEVTVQMVEIYMEKIFDLLIPANQKKPLQIREAKSQVFVQGCVAKPCSSFEQIQRVIDLGDSNRSVGATAMNATSSRAHTVVTINYSKITKLAGKEGRLQSMINIVDLAGSEKQGQAKTSGTALEEGNAINKSLTMLGNVIEKLADISTGKAPKGTIVPYRDSSLTRMLQ